jgi:hypothetical protein
MRFQEAINNLIQMLENINNDVIKFIRGLK